MTTPRWQPQRLDHDPESVKWARSRTGFSQAAFARALGITKSHMSEIERGTRNAPLPLLVRMAAALNCPITVLEAKQSEAGASASVEAS